MVVQHNIPAINSHRNLGINNTNLSKNLEKLSSGYRINRAADDAAGLAISEKMRAQITGLNRAVMNAQDGASLIQTAEGALQEVHSMLNRMVELATQSANGTIQADDRQKIEAETQALKDEIDRISEATNFNGIKLLDGSLSTSGVQEIKLDNLPAVFEPAKAGVYTVKSDVTNVTAAAAGDKVNFALSLSNDTTLNVEFTVSDDGTKLVAADGSTYGITAGAMTATQLTTAIMGEMSKDKAFTDRFEITAATDTITFTAKEAGTKAPTILPSGSSLTPKGGGLVKYDAATVINTVAAEDAYKKVDMTTMIFDGTPGTEESKTFSVNGVKFAVADTAEHAKILENKGIVPMITSSGAGWVAADDAPKLAALIKQKTGVDVTVNAADELVFKELPNTGKGLTMQVGDTADAFNKITVSVDDMSSIGLGIAGISMATQESAATALDAVKSAIEKVSVNRGNLGALQNRLEHTINNLNVTSENMTAAESRIRDVDMAKEMMAFTKNNVLSQAAQAMLAQANQQPQQVLQLLR